MKRVLLVTAHPDDECMFFAPTIRKLVKSGCSVSLLCLSTGDSQGKGPVREAELSRSAAILGLAQVEVLNHPKLQDGMKSEWNAQLIKTLVEERIRNIDTIFTFDNYGVSGHPNHCAISRALSQLDSIPVLHLKSFPLWIKYLGPIGAMLLSLVFKNRIIFHVSVSEAIRSGRAAMYEHRSQMIWFRHLFVIFSIYMYINIYRENKQRQA